MIIAIDGPAASGKSTTAALLAKKLGYIHLNSGLMYRALTYVFIEMNLIHNIPTSLDDFFNTVKLDFNGKNLDQVIYDGKNITNYLYIENINKNIKIISNNYEIRQYLIKLQRSLVKNKNVVCEGRDIGSVVFPKADFKFYLNADIDTRINRRYAEIIKNNKAISINELKNSLIKRDLNDINRKNSPLIKVEDSIEINTTELTITKQVEYLYSIIENRNK